MNPGVEIRDAFKDPHMQDISLMEGSEWEVRVEWHDEKDQFAIFFGDDCAFMYDIADGHGYPCGKCGLWHAPYAPHAPTKAFLHQFVLEHTRLPHWCDLVADCPNSVGEEVRNLLDAAGKWSEPKDEMSQEDATARTVGGLAVHTKERDPGVMRVLAEPAIKNSLSPFVGQPIDERTKAEMADAIHEALKPFVEGSKIEVGQDPNDPFSISANIVFEPRVVPREVRLAKPVVMIGDPKIERSDGKEPAERDVREPEAPAAAPRGECEDSSDMPSSGGEPC